MAFITQQGTRSKAGLPTPPEKQLLHEQAIAAQQQLQQQLQQLTQLQLQQQQQALQMQAYFQAQKAFGDAYNRADFEAYHAGVSVCL